MEITLADGKKMTDQIAVADAHPLGAPPFARPNYINKFQTLTEDLISRDESQHFVAAAQKLGELKANELGGLNVVLPVLMFHRHINAGSR